MTDLLSLSFSGALLQRGFWLYVWEVTAEDGRRVLYVGRTGDSSSANAQSPFNRLSQHLGNNEHANALRRQLEEAGINPVTCRSFDLRPSVKPVALIVRTIDYHTRPGALLYEPSPAQAPH